MVPAGMSNVLDDDTQQRILALGHLGWTLRRIEAATGVRRETVGDYLRAAGIAVRGRGRPGPRRADSRRLSHGARPSPPRSAEASTLAVRASGFVAVFVIQDVAHPGEGP